MPHEVPDRPWQTVAADLFVFGTDKYLVLVDYYSKYFELNQLLDGTSKHSCYCFETTLCETWNSRNAIN